MAESIGALSLRLSADAGPMLADLNRTVAHVRGSARQMHQALGGAGGVDLGGVLTGALAQLRSGGPTTALAGLLGGLTSQLAAGTAASGLFGAALGALGGPVGLVSSLVGTAVGQVMGLVGQFRSLAEEGERTIRQQARLAEQFEMSQEAAGGLQLAASRMGVDTDSMRGALERLSMTLGRAREGSAEAAAAFQRLGVGQEQLNTLTTGEALRILADRLHETASASDRAALAHAFFGRNSHEIVRLLSRGSGALDEATRRAQAFGLAVSAVDAQHVRDAARAMEQANADLAAVRGGVANSLAVAVAPVRQGIGEGISALLEALQPVFEAVRAFFRWIAENVAPFIEGIREGFRSMMPVIQALAQQLSAAFGSLGQAAGTGQGLRDLLRQIGQVVGRQLGTAVGAVLVMITQVTRAIDLLMRVLERYPIIGAQFRQMREALGGALQPQAQQEEQDDHLGALRERYHDVIQQALDARAAMDMTDPIERTVESFAPLGEAMQRHLRDVLRTTQAMQDARREQELWAQAGRQIAQQAQDPLQAFQDRIEQIHGAFEHGTISFDEMSRASAQALAQLDQATGGGQPARMAAAMEAGSASAVSAINRFRRQGTGDDTQRRIREVLERAERHQQETARATRETAREMRRAGVLRPARLQ